MKELSGIFKLAGQNASGMMGLFDAFAGMNPLMMVLQGALQALSPLLEAVGGLFDALVGGFMQGLMPAIKPLLDIIVSLVPTFMDMGKVLGEFTAMTLQPILWIIQALEPLLVPLLELGLIPLTVAMEIMQPILEALAPLFGGLEDDMGGLVPIISMISEAISFLIKFSLWPLAAAVFWVGETIFAIIDALTPGPVAGRTGFRRFFAEMFTTLGMALPSFLKSYLPQEPSGPQEGDMTGGGEDRRIGEDIPIFQSGTMHVPRTMFAMVDAGERIIPEPYVGEQERLLEELIMINKKQAQQQKRADFFRGK